MEIVLQPDLTRVKPGYDLWSKIYDEESNPLVAMEERIIWSRIGDAESLKGLRVLDLGCGTGRHLTRLVCMGAEVTGVDFSPGMLQKAKQKLEALDSASASETTEIAQRGRLVNLVEHNLHQQLPFADGAFDMVVSGLVLEHLQSLDPIFAEAKRVLIPGGRAVFTAMHPAMFLRGTQARFTDPDSGELVMPGSLAHPFADFVMAPLRAGFALKEIAEFAVDESLAREHPRAGKYLGWPILLVLVLEG
jgi:malonyl-CoA O-methyltransferase